jgi:cell division protein ZapA
MDLIAISAVIGDRNYRIKIDPKDEEVVRRTLKTINDKILEFKTQFAGKDIQDYVAMVLIWYATEQHNAATSELRKEEISGQLTAIQKILDQVP